MRNKQGYCSFAEILRIQALQNKTCTRCGSHAINHHLHGRDGSDGELCDVCYWRKRAEQEVNGVISSKVNVWVRELPDFLKEQA